MQVVWLERIIFRVYSAKQKLFPDLFNLAEKIMQLQSKLGTYALILQSHTNADIQVGRWGVLRVEPCYYIYIGSAFGPGGVKARVLRHCRENKRQHWHIDYLKDVAKPVSAWYAYGDRELEHQWAQSLVAVSKVFAVKDFGCSDCQCYSHLFATARRPSFAQFARVVGGDRVASIEL